MSADAIIYCLERVSDYREFERLCSAMLAGAGYHGIEPLGGTGDEGRDAIIRRDETGQRIIFAYTVRSDWRVKLLSDCKRVQEKGHNPNVFVFVCTEALSASEKDFAHAYVAEECGWKLDLFDVERLRVELAGPQRHLVAHHPSIFSPPFFPQRGGQSLVVSPDIVLIDHVDADHAMATWLSRRLTLSGFRIWCRGTAPLAGEDADTTIRALINARANQYLPVLSSASVEDTTFLERCTIAATRDNFVLPCSLGISPERRMPSRMIELIPAAFMGSWQVGLDQVLARLYGLGIKPMPDSDRNRQIALRDFLPTRVTTVKPEPIVANLFALQLPKLMLMFELGRPLSIAEALELRKSWAFVELSPGRLVSFSPPPKPGRSEISLTRIAEFPWADNPERDGKRTIDLAKELTTRSLDVVCARKGLQFCEDRQVFYFPQRESGDWDQMFQHVDGRPTSVQLTGERTKGWGDTASKFRYQLAPTFRPQKEWDGSWNVVVRLYIRVTTLEGVLFEGKEIGRRRKVVSRSWWNKEWLARLLGAVQALQTELGHIVVGEGAQRVVIETKPLTWECPVGLDALALSGMSDIGEEIAQVRVREEDDADNEPPYLGKVDKP
ncbi:MAG: restriction endonuclease [Proteobacteria bacterium]|nr:restriction endonuclease [Pseudomonadota bacterium]